MGIPRLILIYFQLTTRGSAPLDNNSRGASYSFELQPQIPKSAVKKSDTFRLKLNSSRSIGQAWELLFLGKAHPVQPGGRQHLIDCIFVRREFNEGRVGARLDEIDVLPIGIIALPSLKMGSIWVDELVKSEPKRVLNTGMPNGILRQISVELSNPPRAIQMKISKFYRTDLVVPMYMNDANVGELLTLQLFGSEQTRGRSIAVLVPSIAVHKFLLCQYDFISRAIFDAGLYRIMDPELSGVRRDADGMRFVMITARRKLDQPQLRNLAMIIGDPTSRASRISTVRSLRSGNIAARYLPAELKWPERTRMKVSGFFLETDKNALGPFVVQSIDYASHRPDFDRIVSVRVTAPEVGLKGTAGVAIPVRRRATKNPGDLPFDNNAARSCPGSWDNVQNLSHFQD
jgi:hypothetical protein